MLFEPMEEEYCGNRVVAKVTDNDWGNDNWRHCNPMRMCIGGVWYEKGTLTVITRGMVNGKPDFIIINSRWGGPPWVRSDLCDLVNLVEECLS